MKSKLLTNPWLILALLSVLPACRESTPDTATGYPPPTTAIEIVAGSERLDIYWTEPMDWHNQPDLVFELQRRPPGAASFEKAHAHFLQTPAFSDFAVIPGEPVHYRVRTMLLNASQQVVVASAWSKEVAGIANPSGQGDLVDEVQQAAFRYFWNYRHPVSGLPREGIGGWTRNMCSIAATGMMFFNIATGIENQWITREEGLAHIDRVLTFLTEKADRYHGVFPHWINGHTGKTMPFSDMDDGADLVETSFLIYGALFFREYIKDDLSDTAASIRAKADKLWEEVEWTWFVKERPDGRKPLRWHWSPKHGFAIDLEIVGFNECQITYLLALASPTHPITPDSYFNGWIDEGYGRRRVHYDIPLELGREEYGPPLFFTHYSYLGIHPEVFHHGDKNYFQHFEDFCRVQILWAAEHRPELPARGIWGMTASLNPDGYGVHFPGNDNGTISPTASLASMPYAPDAVTRNIALLYEYYHEPFWGPFGFYDAMNIKRGWFSDKYIAINVGPIAPMIENYKTGLGWNTFMRTPEFKRAMEIINGNPPRS